MARHQLSQTGIELIKRFEGFRAKAARLPDGRHVIGYGHVRSARAGATVSPTDAEALLRYDLREVEAVLDEVVYTPLTRNQTDALAAFAFSIGTQAFRRSNVLRRVNEGDLLGAAAAMESWRRAEFEGEPIVVDALVRRRAAEKLLFLTPVGGFIAASSSVLRPELDFGAPLGRSAERAAEIVTPLDGDAAEAERLDIADPFPTPETSPALAAAENVSRRLQALFADDPEPTPQPQDDHPPELASDLASTVATPAASIPEPTVLVELEAAPPVLELTDFDRRIARSEPAEEPTGAGLKESAWPYVVLAVLALMLFAIAIVLILNARAAGETGLLGRQSALGTALALISILGLCTVVYRGLKTLGDDGDKPGR